MPDPERIVRDTLSRVQWDTATMTASELADAICTDLRSWGLLATPGYRKPPGVRLWDGQTKELE